MAGGSGTDAGAGSPRAEASGPCLSAAKIVIFSEQNNHIKDFFPY